MKYNATMTTAERIPMEVLDQAASVLRVLAHPHRLRIVELLSDGPMVVSQLVKELGLAQNAVSQHLNFMKAHGILVSERQGRRVSYRVDNPHATTVLGCIRKHGGGR